jgi:diketogulonate reductase-like aldo/keto reductase
VSYIALNNGNHTLAIGMGWMGAPGGGEAVGIVCKTALKVYFTIQASSNHTLINMFQHGYRLFDTVGLN